MKKSFAVLLCFVMLLSSCSAINDPPIGQFYTTEIAEFGNYNNYVSKHIADYYSGFFPENVSITQIVAYRYHYDCSLLGDPNYSVMVTIRYESEVSFQEEKLRLEEIADNQGEGKYDLRSSFQRIPKLFDDEIQDHHVYLLSFALENNGLYEFTYFVSRFCDGCRIPDEVRSFLLSAGVSCMTRADCPKRISFKGNTGCKNSNRKMGANRTW